jgi:hypothetical protein
MRHALSSSPLYSSTMRTSPSSPVAVIIRVYAEFARKAFMPRSLASIRRGSRASAPRSRPVGPVAGDPVAVAAGRRTKARHVI